MSRFDVCVRALQDAGCGVAFVGNNIVRVRFPPDLNDPVAAPDGEEREYSRAFFTLMVTKTFMELLEQGLVTEDGRGVVAASSGRHLDRRAPARGRQASGHGEAAQVTTGRPAPGRAPRPGRQVRR